jgi:hypothetical protein
MESSNTENATANTGVHRWDNGDESFVRQPMLQYYKSEQFNTETNAEEL